MNERNSSFNDKARLHWSRLLVESANFGTNQRATSNKPPRGLQLFTYLNSTDDGNENANGTARPSQLSCTRHGIIKGSGSLSKTLVPWDTCLGTFFLIENRGCKISMETSELGRTLVELRLDILDIVKLPFSF